jgi:myo-inositol catabolism protein IolC
MPFQHTPLRPPLNTRRLPPARAVQCPLDVYTRIVSKNGYARRLFLLPFHLRRRFMLSAEQRAQIAAAQQVFYEGFRAAVAAGVPKQNAGILLDDRFGAAILRDAVAQGYTVVYPLEKSGQHEFDFEHGKDFARNIEAFHPTFCKVLVRYNPGGDRALNQRQAERLSRLSRYLHERSRSKFMFELLVPPEKFQLEQLQGSTKAYDLWLRPRLTVDAIERLQDAGVEPDVWNIEGLDQPADYQKIVAAARRHGRTNVACIVAASPEHESTVSKWLTVAARVPGFIGFAVGHTDFSEALLCWRDKTMTRNEAVAWIAARYRQFVSLFERTEAFAV